MNKIISFDLQADFGFLRKPDVNSGLQLSYNMLHKPALLGILGAIAGFKGYGEPGKIPEYYERLAPNLRVGIAPLEGFHERGNFSRTVIAYTNTVGYANEDGNLIVQENTLIKPAYRCYLALETDLQADHARLYEQIRAGNAVYVPYLGKNEFHVWWDNVLEYDWDIFRPEDHFKIDSLFIRNIQQTSLLNQKLDFGIDFVTGEEWGKSSYVYFERLPWIFKTDPGFVQYEMAEFAYTDWTFKATATIADLFALSIEQAQKKTIIQLF
jgi:CRISPR-associated protein Cas5h